MDTTTTLCAATRRLPLVAQRARQATRAADEQLRREVAAARDAGASWRDVGNALGITRASARERFGRLLIDDNPKEPA